MNLSIQQIDKEKQNIFIELFKTLISKNLEIIKDEILPSIQKDLYNYCVIGFGQNETSLVLTDENLPEKIKQFLSECFQRAYQTLLIQAQLKKK